MSLRHEITQLRESILQRVERAARTGSARDVVGSSRLLEATEELLGSYDSVETRLQEIKSRLNGTPGAIAQDPGSVENEGRSAKAEGERRRQAFLAEARSRGIEMTRIKGVRYRSPNHNCVGIPSASESDEYRNRWFLGLPPHSYDGFVLLCEDRTGQIHRFVAASDFSAQVLPRLSRDSAGQIKFHVTRDGGRFYLDVPGSERLPLNALLERFEDL